MGVLSLIWIQILDFRQMMLSNLYYMYKGTHKISILKI